MRAFVRLREILLGNRNLAKRLDDLERKYDSQLKLVFDALDQLNERPEPIRRQIGFSSSPEAAPSSQRLRKKTAGDRIS